MSDGLALDPSSLPRNGALTRPAPTHRWVAAFKAVLESLVAAQSGQYNHGEPPMFRFPPL